MRRGGRLFYDRGGEGKIFVPQENSPLSQIDQRGGREFSYQVLESEPIVGQPQAGASHLEVLVQQLLKID